MYEVVGFESHTSATNFKRSVAQLEETFQSHGRGYGVGDENTHRDEKKKQVEKR